MNWRAPRVFLLLMTLGAMASAGADEHDHRRARELQKEGKILPLEKIVARTQKLYPKSKVLEIDLKERDNAYRYEVEIVDRSGVVRELYFNAANGELQDNQLKED